MHIFIVVLACIRTYFVHKVHIAASVLSKAACAGGQYVDDVCMCSLLSMKYVLCLLNYVSLVLRTFDSTM